ncbi:MAG: LysR family transcriptional regulator [Pseudomonadota bacterium]
MDRLDAMRLFLRVADAGSFSKAANDLGIGQPTVSRRIQDLEHRLGADLFQRTTRSLSLTEAGERFYTRAQAILEEFDDAEAEARGLDHEPVGLLRITAPHSLGRLVLAPRLASFLKLYPHIKVDMLLDDGLTDLVEEGIDLAFRLGDLSDSSLIAKRMGEARRRLWASPDYLATRGTPASPSDLEQHDALLFRHISGPTQWTLTCEDGQAIQVTVDGRFRASSGDALTEAAADGLGIILAPDWLVADEVCSGRLKAVLPTWSVPGLAIHCVWTSGKLKGKAKLFAEHLADALRFADPLPCE